MSWTLLLVASVACYVLKLAGLSVPGHMLADERVQRIASAMPIALLAALIALQTWTTGRSLTLDARTGALARLYGCSDHAYPRSMEPAAQDDLDTEPSVPPVPPVPRRRVTRKRVLSAVIGAAIVGVLAWLVFGIGISKLLEKILHLPGWLILLLVFLLPALEAAAFIGVVFPGEIAVLLGGVAASQGSVPIGLVLVAASLGAVIGDQVGYVVGREWGQTVLRKIPDRLLDEDRLQQGRLYIRRMGAKGVVLGRWTAALRALVPGLAGMAHMSYPRFLIANIIGGVGWAVSVGVVGYLAGNSYKKVESALGSVSYVLLGLIVVALIAWHLIRKRRERDAVAAEAVAESAQESASGSEPLV